jgi:hypothetical protein
MVIQNSKLWFSKQARYQLSHAASPFQQNNISFSFFWKDFSHVLCNG